VSEKRRDLGILKAVGAHDANVLTIFLLHGGTICCVGLVLGFLSGLLFCHSINTIHDFIHEQTGWQLFPPDIYYLDRIPVSIKWWDLAQISGFTVLFAFLGSLLPATWAARQDPIQAIRFE
jgi:lipoprotein-releasing system permease protein